MLHLILGRAGSGKTESVRSLMKNISADLRPVLIVPEQSSFENERAMLRLLGARRAQDVTVTSFSRLADLVFRQCGGAAGRRLDDGGRHIFMSLALEQVRDHLVFYRKSAESTELVNLLLSASMELKMCTVTPRMLGETASSLPPGSLKQKLEEMTLILSAYDALATQSYVDPLDDLTRLRSTLEKFDYFRHAIVAFDSFQSFTVQEYHVLEMILRQADDVYITLCTDTLDDPEHGVGLFSLVKRTGKNLIRMAKEHGVRVAVPILLENGGRFRSPELAALEQGAYRSSHTGKENGGNVVIYRGQDVYDEVEFVSASIREMVRGEGFRYRDFAVISRNPESYRGILDIALEQRSIPCFMDEPQAVDTEPLMRLVLSAFQCLRSGFSTENVLGLLKTGLTCVPMEAVAELENYAFVWKLSGKKWREPWRWNPRGFAEELTQEDTALLAYLNQNREAVIEPLVRFGAAVKQANGETMAAAVYHFLEEIHTAEHLRELAKKLMDCGRPDLAERQLRLWDLLMELLDQAALVLGKTNLNYERFSELLKLIIQSSSMASIPQGLDEVTVGAANRIRPAKPRVVFLIGATQGEFPLLPGSGRLFSDGERRELIRMGLPLNDTIEGNAVQERFLAYSAMTYASERLFISFPSSGADGQAKTPSSIVSETKLILKNIKTLSRLQLSSFFFANAKAPAFEWTARQWKENTPFAASLRSCFADSPEYSGRLAAVERAAEKRPFAFYNPEKAAALFGSNMHLSATQIEKYHLCRFQYFCRFGLGAKERRTAELDAMEYGSLMHYLLEHLFRDVGSRKIDEMTQEELSLSVDKLIHDYAQTKLGGAGEENPRLHYLMERLSSAALVIVAHIARELCQSEFTPVDFELSIGTDGVPALAIPLPDGGSMEIDGKIDRVDICDKDGMRYVRVVDYKTGKKEFKLGDVIYGLNMQMLIYLAALKENGGLRYGQITPAGVLYMPANRPSISAPRSITPEKVAEEEDKKLRMTGLLLDSPTVLEAMEPSGEGRFIPVVLKNGTPAKRDHVVSSRELSGVMDHIKRLAYTMAVELRQGHVQAEPLSGETDACIWCPYFPVCGHEKNDKTRPMEKWDRNAAIRELTGGDTL